MGFMMLKHTKESETFSLHIVDPNPDRLGMAPHPATVFLSRFGPNHLHAVPGDIPWL